MPEAASHHVFVYGTLRRGEANDITKLSPAPHYVGTGATAGLLYMVAWYPGLVLGGNEKVTGEVYAITPELERRLDEIEEISEGPDSEYFKRSIVVQVEGVDINCIVYEINTARVRGKALINGGDWLLRH